MSEEESRNPERVAKAIGAARKLRGLARHPNAQYFPATWEEYWRGRFEGKVVMTAYEAIFAVQHDAECTSEEAQEAVEQICPEMFADYWLAMEPPTPAQIAEWRKPETGKKRKR